MCTKTSVALTLSLYLGTNWRGLVGRESIVPSVWSMLVIIIVIIRVRVSVSTQGQDIALLFIFFNERHCTYWQLCFGLSMKKRFYQIY